MKKVLITRFGGIGDSAPMTVVGAQLKKRGCEVHFAVRDGGPNMRLSEMFYKSPAFDKVLDWQEIGPWGSRCIQTDLGAVTINSVFEDYDQVLDFMNIIENNNTSPVCKNLPGLDWMRSRSSNWQNWYDLHLAWANIDPNSVPDEEKRPIFTLEQEELDPFMRLKKESGPIIVIQTSASSLSRTWYQAKRLPKMLSEKFPNCVIFGWEAEHNTWVMLKEGKATRAVPAKGTSPLRFSMALVGSADLFIGADSGFTHVAEALGVPNIALYSTVPAWTRNKYYKHQIAIDPGEQNPEFYTFNLGLGDPLRVLEGEENLSEREKLVAKLYQEGKAVEEACQELNVDKEGAELELKSLISKKSSWERQQSKALSSISPERVFEKAVEVLGRGVKNENS